MRNNIEEYQVLKSELNMRIDKMYTNNYAIITLMFAAWTIITSVYINSESKLLSIIVALLPILFAIITAVLLSQWNENLAGIAALAAYVRIFYEMPSIFSDEDTFCWETCVASTRFLDPKKTASSNKTYVIVLIISVLLSTALCLDFSINTCLKGQNAKKATCCEQEFPYNCNNQKNEWAQKENVHDVKSIIIVGSIFVIGIFFWLPPLIKNLRLDSHNITFSQIYIFIRIKVEKFNFPAKLAKKYLDDYIFYVPSLDYKEKMDLDKKISEIQSKDKNYLALKEFLDSKIAQQ